jgi:DNA-binding transcriptional ArsR family regulator
MSTKFNGTRRLIDADTGEIIEAQTITKTAGDAGFHKIWLHHILEAVDEVGNAKMRVLMWLLTKADSQNLIMATYKEIAEETKVGLSTVRRLTVALREAAIIVEVRRSVWRLNPDVVFKGNHDRRMSVLIKYRDESQGDMFEEAPKPAQTEPLRSVA